MNSTHVEHELICWIFCVNSLSLVSRGHFSTHMTLKKAFKKEEKQENMGANENAAVH